MRGRNSGRPHRHPDRRCHAGSPAADTGMQCEQVLARAGSPAAGSRLAGTGSGRTHDRLCWWPAWCRCMSQMSRAVCWPGQSTAHRLRPEQPQPLALGRYRVARHSHCPGYQSGIDCGQRQFTAWLAQAGRCHFVRCGPGTAATA